MAGPGQAVAGVSSGEDPANAVRWFSARIKEGRRDEVVDRLGPWNPRQVFQLMRDLPLSRARTLFTWLPLTRAVGILDIVDPRAAADLSADETVDRLVEILTGVHVDDATAIVAVLPEETRERVIARVPAGTELAARVSYGVDTAGEIMTEHFVAVPATRTLIETVAAIQHRAASVGEVRAVYVTGSGGELIGYLEPEDLLVHAGDEPIGDWIRTDYVSVTPALDQEQVLRLAQSRQVKTIPVVAGDGRLVGGITTEELAWALNDEVTQDAFIGSGVNPDASPNDSVRQIVAHRLPWLIAGLMGSTIAGVAIVGFEDQLLEAAILASFIPIVMAMAGNAGIQASQVTVAGISTGTIWEGDQWRRFGREAAGALLNSAFVGLALTAVIIGASQFVDIDRASALAMTAALALIIAMTLAVTLGATLPIGLNRLGVDPAVSTGVFIAAANDILGVSVFFVIASALYL